jgi:hypothetical protein
MRSPKAMDREIVALQIGRDPRGAIAVVARCEYGLPSVVRTSPRLDDGSPFPTLYYLTCPMAVRAIGRLEATGKMKEYEAMLASDADLRAAYADADARYRAQRDAVLPLADEMQTAGGMPGRVKCLHALYAHDLADANPVGALARAEIEPLGCPGPCVSEEGERAPGHPGFQGKKRRV